MSFFRKGKNQVSAWLKSSRKRTQRETNKNNKVYVRFFSTVFEREEEGKDIHNFIVKLQVKAQTRTS